MIDSQEESMRKTGESRLLAKAIRIAATVHEAQVDKGLRPYILHSLRVMFAQSDDTARICAVLHDVVEDSGVSIDDLRAEGFAEEVLSTLATLTKRKGEAYEDYIGRVLESELACRVKLADLQDNMDLSRIANPTEDNYRNLEKYKRAEERLSKAFALRGLNA